MLISRDAKRPIHADEKDSFRAKSRKNVSNFSKTHLTFVIEALKYTL